MSRLAPISRVRLLLRVWGRMNDPVLSSPARTGSRLVRLRLRTKELEVMNRGRSQDDIRGSNCRVVENWRSRSTPTSIPRKLRLDCPARRPRLVESG